MVALMIYNMFPTQIYKCKIDPKSYDKEKIIEECTKKYDEKPYYNLWDNVSDLHHYHRDHMNMPDIKSLGTAYGQAIDDYMSKIKGTFNYKWHVINLAVNSKYMKLHDHFARKNGWQSMFGSTHYISYDKEYHTPTKFINPLVFAQYSDNIHDVMNALHYDYANSAYWVDADLDVEEDDMIIFPSYLKHVVENGYRPGSKPRIVGVTNIDWKIN
jgi:hypothetical protein